MTSTIARSIVRSAAGTAALLLIPLFGNRFVEGWNWSPGDFAVMGTILFVVGIALAMVLQSESRYRIIAAITIVVLFVWLWAELAVGVFTNWGS